MQFWHQQYYFCHLLSYLLSCSFYSVRSKLYKISSFCTDTLSEVARRILHQASLLALFARIMISFGVLNIHKCQMNCKTEVLKVRWRVSLWYECASVFIGCGWAFNICKVLNCSISKQASYCHFLCIYLSGTLSISFIHIILHDAYQREMTLSISCFPILCVRLNTFYYVVTCCSCFYIEVTCETMDSVVAHFSLLPWNCLGTGNVGQLAFSIFHRANDSWKDFLGE